MAACHDPEGWRAASHLRKFDTTPCFEEGIILSSLLSILLVAATLRSISLSQEKALERSSRSILALRFKLVLIVAAVLTAIANIAYVLTQHKRVPVLQSYILESLALASTFPLTIYNHNHTRTSSTILLLFWPAYIIGLAIWLRTILSTHNTDFYPVVIIRCVAAFFGVASYAIECFGPEIGHGIKLGEGQGFVEHPIITANIYSIWSFAWMTPLMKKGASRFITEDDLPTLPPKEEARNLGHRLDGALKKRSLWKALFAAYGRRYAVAGILKVSQDCLAFLQPQLLRLLLAYISRYQSVRSDASSAHPSPVEGFFITVLMFIASIVQTIILHQYFQRCFETGMRVRAGLATAIYSKALVLSNDVRGQSSGDIVNLMSVDATRLQDFCTYGFIVISGPLQITLAFISLYNLLGWSAFVGIAIMIFSIPGQTIVARYLKRLQEAQMKSRDARTRLMSEVLANIKSIKLYGWEFAFIRRVLGVRNDQELRMLKKIGVLTSFNMTLWGGIPLLVAFSSFATAATVMNKPLTSDVIFPSISLFMLLQFPLAMFSQVTSNLIEAIVSIQRLSAFFAADELQADARAIIEKPNLKTGDEVLSIKHGEFCWSKTDPSPTLEDINVSIKKGQLFGILGRVGAGKTSLLSAMIGDMTKTDGEVIVSGNIAYASQNPWILSATVRDNILFSHEYEEDFYNMVLDACALRHDLSLLQQGDLTEVGEKGITLSGGQRARISLARAVYSRADIILLDDVFAAVDSHVARHLFDKVVGPDGILSTKARVVATNSVAFLKEFDELVFIRRGIILESGSYEALFSNDEGEVHKLISSHGTGASGTSTPFVKSGSATPEHGSSDSENIETGRATPNFTGDEKRNVILRRKSFRRALIKPSTSGLEPPSHGMSKEHSEQGKVKTEVYARYIAAASKIGFALYILAVIGQQVTSVLSTFALRSWGEHNREAGSNDEMWRYLFYYGGASLASTIFGGVAAVVIWVLCGIKSAKVLHEEMLNAVMMAPLNFFELTPTGRILNLFSRDTYVVDQVLVRVISSFFRTLAIVCSIVLVIGGSFPPFLFAVIPLGWFYLRVMKYYLATSRELKRLDAVSRSPIFAWFSESLAGLSTIRAYSQQAVFEAKNHSRIDRNQMCYLPSISVNRWLAVRLEFVGALIILIASLLAMVALITTGVDAGLVGLVLSYALSATSSLNWFVRSASEVEQNIVSVERILHYVELQPEGNTQTPDPSALTEGWPQAGEVEFRNYSARYRPELDLVLNDVSFKINPKEKIGICGRTGAGKSSLLLALFRIIEASEGSILIDGVDISKISLHDLRTAISIVPQSPDLFEGTLRENVDPVGEYDDAAIWTVLGQTYLKEYAESIPGGVGLDAPVREGGMSLSAGQRQLLCFARALLRKSRILVLDEATSAVDMDTDRDIQRIISGPEFANVTMFTIAHRLNTIIDCDRVMVLDSGKLAELDSPKNLLAKKDSIFYSLALEAGLVTS